MQVEFSLDMSDYLQKIREFLESIDGQELFGVALDAETVARWDKSDDGREIVRQEILSTIVAEAPSNAGMLQDEHENVLAFMKKADDARWTMLVLPPAFRMPIEEFGGKLDSFEPESPD